MEGIDDAIARVARDAGASLTGGADLTRLPAAVRERLPYGLSFGVALNREIVAGIKHGPTIEYVEECRRADERLVEIGAAVAAFLTEHGHRALPRTRTGPDDPATLETVLPQKTVATRAGLGWVGKCALLVTEEFGSCLRLGCVLTDAPVPTNEPIDRSGCGDCSVCVTVCPAQTITGHEWNPGTRRSELLDPFACRRTARALLEERTGGAVTGRTFCGLCMVVCPFTQRYLEQPA